MAVPPSILRGRIRTTTYLFDDPENPGRRTGSVTTAEWTEEDRAALLGLEMYEATLCPGCQEPRETAWHADAEGEYEAQRFVCHGCLAKSDGHQASAVYSVLTGVPSPERVAKFLPFDLLTTTTEPTPEGA